MLEFLAVAATSVNKEYIAVFKSFFLDVNFEVIKMPLFTVHKIVTSAVMANFIFDADPKYRANIAF